jgi:hypothetical protein
MQRYNQEKVDSIVKTLMHHAKHDADQSILMNENNPFNLFMLGDYFERTLDYDRALRSYGKIPKETAEYNMARFNMGAIYLLQYYKRRADFCTIDKTLLDQAVAAFHESKDEETLLLLKDKDGIINESKPNWIKLIDISDARRSIKEAKYACNHNEFMFYSFSFLIYNKKKYDGAYIDISFRHEGNQEIFIKKLSDLTGKSCDALRTECFRPHSNIFECRSEKINDRKILTTILATIDYFCPFDQMMAAEVYSLVENPPVTPKSASRWIKTKEQYDEEEKSSSVYVNLESLDELDKFKTLTIKSYGKASSVFIDVKLFDYTPELKREFIEKLSELSGVNCSPQKSYAYKWNIEGASVLFSGCQLIFASVKSSKIFRSIIDTINIYCPFDEAIKIELRRISYKIYHDKPSAHVNQSIFSPSDDMNDEHVLKSNPKLIY